MVECFKVYCKRQQLLSCNKCKKDYCKAHIKKHLCWKEVTLSSSITPTRTLTLEELNLVDWIDIELSYVDKKKNPMSKGYFKALQAVKSQILK